MKEEELKKPDYLEIKFYRLSSPLFNYSNTSLSGLYNPLLNNESNEYQLKSTFKNFDIVSPDFINTENLLSLSSNQNEKVLVYEKMDNFVTFVNNSKDELTIKDLKILLKPEDSKSKVKEKEVPFKSNLNENQKIIKIPSKKSYSIFFSKTINYAGKYQFIIKCTSLSPLYDIMYKKKNQRNIIKRAGVGYLIKESTVEFEEVKKINFEVYDVLNIKPKFYNNNVNQCFISIKIRNVTETMINIVDVKLISNGIRKDPIPLVKNLDEIKKSNNNNINSKHLTLQSKEELMVLFKITTPDLYYYNNDFILKILWLKNFDFNEKKIEYKISNKLNTYNEYYIMTITEKPDGDIIINQNFKIVINLRSKDKRKKYLISISQEQIKDDDNKSTDREIEIIDIIEKKIELNEEKESNNFILICKSDILGNVYLPKLKFTVNEGDQIQPKENIYDNLLCFNCIPK